jgi:hypothetical protein
VLVALAQLEGVGGDHVLLLDADEARVEHRGLGEVVVEGRRCGPADLARDLPGTLT